MSSGPVRTAKPFVANRRVTAWAGVACALAFSAAAPVRAAEVSLYRVTVPLKGSTEEDRNAAFAEALRAVVVRASGRRDAGSNPGISQNAGRANRLVQQYAAISAGELTVGFDPELDRKRFVVSDRGITLITPEMLGQESFHQR